MRSSDWTAGGSELQNGVSLRRFSNRALEPNETRLEEDDRIERRLLEQLLSIEGGVELATSRGPTITVRRAL
jgi:hypothetical protein